MTLSREESKRGDDRKNIFLNLKGETCSYTFLRCKLQLEELSPGDVLEVLVDHLPATVDVPKCLSEEGHRVLEVQRISDTVWKIIVEKGEGE